MCSQPASVDNLVPTNVPYLVVNPGSSSSCIVFQLSSTNFCDNLVNTAAFIVSLQPVGTYFMVAVYDNLPPCVVYYSGDTFGRLCAKGAAYVQSTSGVSTGAHVLPSSIACTTGDSTTFNVVASTPSVNSTHFAAGFVATSDCSIANNIVSLVLNYFNSQPCNCTSSSVSGGCSNSSQCS